MSVSGFNDNVVWGRNEDRKIYRLKGRQSWEQIDGTLVQVSAGQAGVWGVNYKNMVWYRKGTYGGAVRFVEQFYGLRGLLIKKTDFNIKQTKSGKVDDQN